MNSLGAHALKVHEREEQDRGPTTIGSRQRCSEGKARMKDNAGEALQEQQVTLRKNMFSW